jgi:hypothetical protein
MTRRTLQRSLSATALVLATSLFLVHNASARTIRVDVGYPGNYNFTGQAWNPAVPLVPPGPLSGTLPFAIDFGTGNQTAFCLYEDGQISFGEAVCSAIPDPNATLDVLAADWVGTGAPNLFDTGSITYSDGNLAAEPPYDPPSPPLPEDAPRAVRFHWNDVTCPTCGGVEYSFQAILIDVDGAAGGDFDIELNYGFGGIPAGVGAIGLVLGGNQFEHTGAVANDESFDLQFRNGVLVDGTTAVPEPSTLLLLMLAFLTMQTLRRRSTG